MAGRRRQCRANIGPGKADIAQRPVVQIGEVCPVLRLRHTRQAFDAVVATNRRGAGAKSKCLAEVALMMVMIVVLALYGRQPMRGSPEVAPEIGDFD